MITKRDIERLAAALKISADLGTVEDVAAICADSNPRFNRTQFMRACGWYPGIHGIEKRVPSWASGQTPEMLDALDAAQDDRDPWTPEQEERDHAEG